MTRREDSSSLLEQDGPSKKILSQVYNLKIDKVFMRIDDLELSLDNLRSAHDTLN